MIAALLGLIGALLGIVAPAGECRETSRSVYLMGTTAVLTSCSAARADGLADLESYLGILEQTEQELSTWREDSVISRLNRHPVGQEFDLSPHLLKVFLDLQAWSEKTAGAFDPTVGALTGVWGVHVGGRIPSAREIESARARTGMDLLRLNAAGGSVSRRADVIVDVGGFGKGEGLDRAADYAESRKNPAFLIDLGGQVIVRTSSDHPFWTVDIAHPVRRDQPVVSIQLSSGSLSTSGGSERDSLVDGKRIGHIVDPRSGQTVASDVSAVVWHERALVADILSTALYVMGAEEGLKWAERNNIAASFLVPSASGIDLRASTAWSKRYGQ